MNDIPPEFVLLCDIDVIAQLRLAYEESGVGTDHPVEQGGFIVARPTDGAFEVVRLPARERNSFTYPVCADGMYLGRRIMGSFDTHPNVGPEWRQEPSRQDIRLSQEYPETMGMHQFVISKETIYHIDNDGVVTEVGLTHRLLGLREEPLE